MTSLRTADPTERTTCEKTDGNRDMRRGRSRRTAGVACAAILLAVIPTIARADVSDVVDSAAERSGDTSALRDLWWQQLSEDPDSVASLAILARWSAAVADAPGDAPTAADWRALAARAENGWNRRRMLWFALDASRSEAEPAFPADLGLDAGFPRHWIGIGPYGRRAESELHTERATAERYTDEVDPDGTHGPVSWRPVHLGPHEVRVEPSRLSSLPGAGWVLRSRFGTGEAEGFLQVSTRGSLRVLLDGEELLTVDRTRDHLPRVLRAPLALNAGNHTLVVRSDGAPFQLLLREPSGEPIAVEDLPPEPNESGAGWEPRPQLVAEGLPDTDSVPEDALERAMHLWLAVESEDPYRIETLLPARPGDEDGAVAFGMVAEWALPQVEWLPSEMRRSRQDEFRRAALAADPTLVPIRLAEAETQAGEDRIPEAMRTIDAVLETAPESIAAWSLREWIARENGWRRERDAALAALERIAPEHPRVLARLQNAAEDQGREDLARELGTRAFELQPRMSGVTSLVRDWLRAGEPARARAILDRLEGLEPGSLELLRIRFRLAGDTHDVARARELSEEWHRRMPDAPEPFDNLAELLLEIGETGAALAAFERAAEIDPGRAARARTIENLRADFPLPGRRPDGPWMSEVVDTEEVIGSAPPEGNYPGANAVLLLDQMVTHVTEDEGTTEYVHQVIRLESQEAVAEYSTLPTSGEVLELWIRTPEGRVLEPTGGAGGGGYTLPGLAPGAIINVRTVRRSSLARQKDLQIGPFYFQDPQFAAAFHRTEWIVHLPAEWDPEIVVRGGAAQPEETRDGAYRRLAWRVDGSARAEPEDLTPPADEILPNVQIRSRLTWDEVLPQVAASAVRDDRPTPTLVAAAEEILEGVDGERARVEALFDAVCTRITSGGGGSSATEVWLSRSGDRDLALAGLLRAAGIEFRNVLAGPSPDRIPWVDWANPREASFQARLIELTGADGEPYWLTIPFRMTPFGRLPMEIREGRALRASRTGGTWFHIPPGDPSQEGQVLSGTITLDPQGGPPAFDGALEIRALGGSRLKEQIKDMQPFLRSTMLEQFVQGTLPGSRMRGGGFENYTDRDAPLRVEFDIEAPSLVQMRDGVPSLPLVLLPNQLRNLIRKPSRTYPIFGPGQNYVEERLAIELGDAFRVADLPPDVDLEGPWGRFHTQARVEGTTLRTERVLELRPFSAPADDWAALTEFCRAVDRAEEARIALEVVTP